MIPRHIVRHVVHVLVLLTASLLSQTVRAEPSWYVSPEGNDAWSGRLADPNDSKTDGPLSTLHKAVELSRQVGKDQHRRIIVQQGYYYLNQPIELGADDSQLEIAAVDNARVVLYGGRTIEHWQPDGDDCWSADLPEVKDGRWDFRLLVVNDRLCPRARLPQDGQFTHESQFNVPWMSTTGGGWKRKPTREELTTLKYRPNDIGPWLDLKNAEITVYHMWDESVVGLRENDVANHLLRFATPCGHPPGAFGVRKCVIWNVRQGMTQPGQWYLDRTEGKVVYWPLPGEDMKAVHAMAPTLESIFRIQGSRDKPVRDVTIRGMTCSVTNTPLVAGGFGAGKFAGALELIQGVNCRLLDLEINNVAGQGIKVWNSQSSTIEGCHVHDTGACGLRFSGSCIVRNNHVHDIGRIYPSAIAIWCGGREGQASRIEHNTVHDTPYTAIACGGEDHRIEHNRISRAMQQLHDGAGIYISMCKRIVLRGNYVHDIVDTGEYGASAYYLDEQAEDCLVEGNLSLRVARPSHNHMAHGNTLRGNVFVCEGDATLTFARSSDYCLQRNVIVAQGAVKMTRPEAVVRAEDNILFSRQGSVEGIKLDDYREVGRGTLQDGGWLTVDPLLTEFDSGRVRFAPDSPAVKLGIEAIDVSSAGCVESK